MAEADLARKWPELDAAARQAAISASSTVGMHGTDAERALLQEVLAAMDKARKDKDGPELERQMRLAQRLSSAAFNRTSEAWEWYFEDAASEISEARDLPRANKLVGEGKAAIDRGDTAELRRVVKALWQLLPEDSEARKKRLRLGSALAPMNIEDNPFFVLGLPTDASRIEIEREAQKLLGMLELGFADALTYRRRSARGRGPPRPCAPRSRRSAIPISGWSPSCGRGMRRPRRPRSPHRPTPGRRPPGCGARWAGGPRCTPSRI